MSALEKDVSELRAQIADLLQRADATGQQPYASYRGVLDIERLPGSDDGEYPFQVFIEDGYVCVREGHHIWWNSYTMTAAVTTLSKTVGDAWVAPASATVIYVKRVYNSDGTATVTLEYANTDYASVMAGVTTTETRWILATLSGGAVQTQWWRAGDIPEWRVS